MKTTKLLLFVILYLLLQFATVVYSSSNELLDSWTKINANYANDVEQSYKIYSKIKEEQHALNELHTIVERHLRTKNAELLVNFVNSSNVSLAENNMQELMKNLSDNYNNQMIDSIFAEAINEIILTNNLQDLPDILWNIYQKNDTKLFDIMLHAQLQLYNNFGQKPHIEEKEFLQHYANKLYLIKKDHLYNTVDYSLKLKMQNIVEQLPNNLKYLYFMPYFCLLNIKYSTYIYTAIELKVDPLSRYIWLWRDSRSMDDTGFITAEVGSLKKDNELNVLLKGVKYQMYYYMMPDTMNIAGWDSTDTPVNYIWNIEFLDKDRVVLSHNDYLMCAVENHDNDRRNVKGLKRGTVSTMNSECQWRLGQCSFK